MGDEKADGDEAVPLVKERHSLEAERMLQPRQAGHQEQLPKDEVGADKAGDPAKAVEEVGAAADGLKPGAEPPEAEDQDRVEGEERAIEPRPGPGWGVLGAAARSWRGCRRAQLIGVDGREPGTPTLMLD